MRPKITAPAKRIGICPTLPKSEPRSKIQTIVLIWLKFTQTLATLNRPGMTS